MKILIVFLVSVSLFGLWAPVGAQSYRSEDTYRVAQGPRTRSPYPCPPYCAPPTALQPQVPAYHYPPQPLYPAYPSTPVIIPPTIQQFFLSKPSPGVPNVMAELRRFSAENRMLDMLAQQGGQPPTGAPAPSVGQTTDDLRSQVEALRGEVESLKRFHTWFHGTYEPRNKRDVEGKNFHKWFHGVYEPRQARR